MKSLEQEKSDKIQAEKLLQKADIYYYENKFNKALKLYIDVKNLDVINPILYYKIGFCYDKGQQQIDKAEKYYLKALKKLNIKDNLRYLSAIYFNLGVIAAKRQDISKKFDYLNSAYSLLEKMLTLEDMNGEDLFRLAYYYMDKSETEKAIKFFRLSIKLFKKENTNHFYYAGAYYNIGIIYWKQEDINTALWYWKKALIVEPDNEKYQLWYQKARQIKQAGGL